jgi:type II secretory pathway pseudopilin PulG
MSARRPKGTTLVEALIALTILAVGVLGMISGGVAISRQNAVARRRTAAQTLATELGSYLGTQPTTSPLLSCTVSGCAAPSPARPTLALSGATPTFTPDPGPHVEAALAAAPITGVGSFAGLSDTAGRRLNDGRFWRAWYVSEPEPGFRTVSVYVFFDSPLGGQDVVEYHTGAFDTARLGSTLGLSAL